MAPYTGAPPEPLIEVKLDSNESAAALPALDPGDGGVLPNRYKRTSELEAQIAGRLGVEPANVLVTAGADDGLERAFRAVCAPGRVAVLTTPTFEILERFATLADAEIVRVPWWTGDFPVDGVFDLATPSTSVVAVVTPNNPTGAVASRNAVASLAERLPQALILLDHAYVEFAEPGDDLTGCAAELPNVVVFRTFSKAWSAAGLRVGYAIGDPRVLRWMRTLGQPYPVSAPSLAMVRRLLDEHDRPPADRIDRVRQSRALVTGTLEDLGVEVLPSRANFVLARVGDATWVRRALVCLGVGVRAFPGRPGLDEWVRITVPESDEAAQRLEHALRTVLAPEAILFDLDGVLADVSGSYREVMRRTAADFGVEISAVEIAEAKAEGHANNDWVLTQRMLAARGVEAPLEEVGARFESWYQGTDERPGLWRNERVLAEAPALERLAGGRPLAIVTGRPLQDAKRFLDGNGFGQTFQALVTMEDGPSKPDPHPVRVALERLGVRRAWMVGDTPDDLNAARAAGVLPIGCRAPGEAAVADEAMLAAGAARVFSHVKELEEVLP
jgi:histidinol-phosphate aminotransferase